MKKLLALLGLGLVLAVGFTTTYNAIMKARVNHLLETYVLTTYGSDYELRNTRTVTNPYGDNTYVIDVVNEHGERIATDLVVKFEKEY